MPGPAFSPLLLPLLLLLLLLSAAAPLTRALSAAPGSSANEAVVTLPDGPVLGVLNAQYRAFKGIPYASPPVGAARWQPPTPNAPWAPSTLNATEFAPGCPQDCHLPAHTCPTSLSEDCLTLNVYTPRVAVMEAAAEPLPVMFFVPGGNFQFGTGGCLLYEGEGLVATGNVILVAINYRLGVLGWVYDGQGMKGNYGLQDQRLALQWTNSNIHLFGGDASRITLFGQSAGGTSTGAHLVSPDSQGLFSRAVMHSNPIGIPNKTPERAVFEAQAFYTAVGCSFGDIACARGKNFAEIVDAQKEANHAIDFAHPLQMFQAWTPLVTPNGTLPYEFIDGMKAGKFDTTVPVMMGSVLEDCRLFIWRASKTKLTTAKYIAAVGLVFELFSPKVLGRFPPEPLFGDKRPLLSSVGTEYIFACSARMGATYISENSQFPVHVYQFNQTLSWKGWGEDSEACDGHVCHGAELPFLFNPPHDKVGVTFTPGEEKVSAELISRWSNFAYSGDPNKGPSTIAVPWNPFNNETKSLLEIKPLTENILNQWGADCDFWDATNYVEGW